MNNELSILYLRKIIHFKQDISHLWQKNNNNFVKNYLELPQSYKFVIYQK